MDTIYFGRNPKSLVNTTIYANISVEHYNFYNFFLNRFGSKAVSWKPTMMKPTEQNLQAAWR